MMEQEKYALFNLLNFNGQNKFKNYSVKNKTRSIDKLNKNLILAHL